MDKHFAQETRGKSDVKCRMAKNPNCELSKGYCAIELHELPPCRDANGYENCILFKDRKLKAHRQNI
ncbi:hypothetical protein COV15_00080 [Candidatus Woesearchaeota archaeon CG10_big_fil_rev_8_21_14_0_10_34_12]|nr:MAG: hypothetical protein COV15_00080 [Candidatus Woesearchaeota archaeon CG10_big_fil_rev_8_21_14_0_10_34_12]